MIRKYKSKYANLTMEEYMKAKNEKYKEWLKKQDRSVIDKYNKLKKRQCEVCHEFYGNIYQHYKSKKHIKNLNNI